jgi:hypothetical protein
VNIKRIIQRRTRRAGKGVNAVGDFNAVTAASVNERNSRTRVSTRSRQRIVQRSGRTTYARDDATRGGDQMRSKEDVATEAEPESKAEEDADTREPVTPAIDEDVAGSVNAALPGDDDE